MSASEHIDLRVDDLECSEKAYPPPTHKHNFCRYCWHDTGYRGLISVVFLCFEKEWLMECLSVLIMPLFCMFISSIAYVNNNVQLFQLQMLHEISRWLYTMN